MPITVDHSNYRGPTAPSQGAQLAVLRDLQQQRFLDQQYQREAMRQEQLAQRQAEHDYVLGQRQLQEQGFRQQLFDDGVEKQQAQAQMQADLSNRNWQMQHSPTSIESGLDGSPPPNAGQPPQQQQFPDKPQLMQGIYRGQPAAIAEGLKRGVLTYTPEQESERHKLRAAWGKLQSDPRMRPDQRAAGQSMLLSKWNAIQPHVVPENQQPVDPVTEASQGVVFNGPNGPQAGLPPQGYTGPVWTKTIRNGAPQWTLNKIEDTTAQEQQKSEMERQKFEWQQNADERRAVLDEYRERIKGATSYRAELLKLKKTAGSGEDVHEVPLYSPQEVDRMVNEAFPAWNKPPQFGPEQQPPQQVQPQAPPVDVSGGGPMNVPPQGMEPPQAPPMVPPEQAAPPGMAPPEADASQAPQQIAPLSPEWFAAEPELKPLADAIERVGKGGKPSEYLTNFRNTLEQPIQLPIPTDKRFGIGLKDGAVYQRENGERWIFFRVGAKGRFVKLP